MVVAQIQDGDKEELLQMSALNVSTQVLEAC